MDSKGRPCRRQGKNCPVGSDPSAAGGGKSEVSEWQRSTDAKVLCHRRQMSGTATGTVFRPWESPSVCGRILSRMWTQTDLYAQQTVRSFLDKSIFPLKNKQNETFEKRIATPLKRTGSHWQGVSVV